MRTARRGRDLSPWYVTGFVESAGSFTYNRSGDRLTLIFAVRLSESNRTLLARLQRFFDGIGRIYTTRVAREKEGTPRTRNVSYYRVNRTRELLRVVEHFDAYPLRGRKRTAFRVWREMVFLRATHHGSRPPDELNDLAAKLSARRTRPFPAP
jgi:hypothetical protein